MAYLKEASVGTHIVSSPGIFVNHRCVKVKDWGTPDFSLDPEIAKQLLKKPTLGHTEKLADDWRSLALVETFNYFKQRGYDEVSLPRIKALFYKIARQRQWDDENIRTRLVRRPEREDNTTVGWVCETLDESICDASAEEAVNQIVLSVSIEQTLSKIGVKEVHKRAFILDLNGLNSEEIGEIVLASSDAVRKWRQIVFPRIKDALRAVAGDAEAVAA